MGLGLGLEREGRDIRGEADEPHKTRTGNEQKNKKLIQRLVTTSKC